MGREGVKKSGKRGGSSSRPVTESEGALTSLYSWIPFASSSNGSKSKSNRASKFEKRYSDHRSSSDDVEEAISQESGMSDDPENVVDYSEDERTSDRRSKSKAKKKEQDSKFPSFGNLWTFASAFSSTAASEGPKQRQNIASNSSRQSNPLKSSSTTKTKDSRTSRSTTASRASAARTTALSRASSRVLEVIKSLVPKTKHGWGVLLLTFLMIFYLVDFVLILRSSPDLAHTQQNDPLQQDRSQGSVNSIPDSGSQPIHQAEHIPKPIELPEPPVPPQKLSTMRFESKTKEDSLDITHKDGGSSSEKQNDFTIEEAQESKKPVAKEAVEHKDEQELSNRKILLRAKQEAMIKTREERQYPHMKGSPFNRGLRKDLMVPADAGVLPREGVSKYYKKLVAAYLEPYADLKGIPRKFFLDILKRRTYALTPPGASKGTSCILVQIVRHRLYVLDPYGVRDNAKPFYRTRIQQLIWLLSRVAAKENLADTEFLVSIHDCVQTASAEHSYRGPSYVENNPVFTIVGCNFSDNIPFPMWEGSDGSEHSGGYLKWDRQMAEFGQKLPSPWESKDPRAVFRGGVRTSMYFKDKSEQEKHCDEVSRTALLALAQKEPDLLDVSVGGTCGGVHHNLAKILPEEHHKYKYVVYAEGNCFWADRLNHQLFAPNVIVKQETPCGQFYEPLLKPFGHYIPTDFFFSDLIEKLKWARNNDQHVHDMVRAANDFAQSFLSLSGIEIYVQELLTEYTKLLLEPVKKEKGAVEITDLTAMI
uniref:Glycosyl transferase CAP10 domain-containing protein n=1 Tax=Timspurckia oligopyrenoides TaxID=708627 RepID=A0A7S0ZCR7_9RHOD|mmetsp:Transcript_12697/g.22848  ORF Transcript_12697/g.22848 Transcript_12697/m.22848 type:complete len:763 (+) Transcript_12697:59-2347(+)